METRAAVAGKKIESKMDEIEGLMASFKTELTHVGSRLDRMNRLDVD